MRARNDRFDDDEWTVLYPDGVRGFEAPRERPARENRRLMDELLGEVR